MTSRDTTTDRAWQQDELARTFLEGIRGGIPLAAEQLDVLLRIVRANFQSVGCFLDLGCGDGVLGRAVLSEYPDAIGVFLDFSDHMIQAARRQVSSAKAEFLCEDFARADWIESVRHRRPFDLVISGFSIHHQPHERKQQLYEEVFGLLVPGGLFLNLEHVSSRATWAVQAFDDMTIDSLCAFHRLQGQERNPDEIAADYVHRPDRAANILAPVELQCRWLEEIGFVDVDCFFKVFEIALFGGRKPLNESEIQSRKLP